MTKAKILRSTDDHAPLVTISSFEDMKTLLRAFLVDGIPECGGAVGWTEQFDDADGFVLRDDNVGNTRDWIMREFVNSGYTYIDVRGCDTASSTTTGVNVFPSEAIVPFDDSSVANRCPCFSLSNGSYPLRVWQLVATGKTVHFMYQVPGSYEGTKINEGGGWAIMSFGHYNAHGANTETAYVSGSSCYNQYYSLTFNMFMGNSSSQAPRYIQRTPDADAGDGALDFYADADRIAVCKATDSAVSVAAGLSSRAGLPDLDTVNDPIITSTIWVVENGVVLGSMPGLKYVNAKSLPPVSQGMVSEYADGKDYSIFRIGGTNSTTDGACMLVNLTDDWDI